MIITDPHVLAILYCLGLIAGFVDSIAGGGGLIMAPALLSAGVPPHVMLATNKLMSFFGTATAAKTFVRKKIFEPKAWKTCAIATLIGGVAGALLILFMRADFIRKFIPPLLIIIAIYMLIPKPKNTKLKEHPPVSKSNQILSGLGLGFYDGFIGPGAGSFWTVLYNSYFKQDFMVSTGIARFMNLMSNIAALSIFIISGKVSWLFGFFMASSFMIGSFIGAHSAIAYGEKYIRPLFIAFVMIIACRLVYIEYF